VLSNAFDLMIVPPIILLASVRRRRNASVPRYVEASSLCSPLSHRLDNFSKEGEALFACCPIILRCRSFVSAVRFRLEGLCLCLLLVAYFAFSMLPTPWLFAMNSPEQTYSLFNSISSDRPTLMLLAVLIEERGQTGDAAQSEARYRRWWCRRGDGLASECTGEGSLLPDVQNTGRTKSRCALWLAGAAIPRPRAEQTIMQQRCRDRHAYENELASELARKTIAIFTFTQFRLSRRMRCVRVGGTNTDITERKRAEMR